MTKSKTATEVLLDIQQKVEYAVKLCEDTNHNVKKVRSEIELIKRSGNVSSNAQSVEKAPSAPTTPSVVAPTETNKHSMVEQTLLYKSTQLGVALADIKVYDVETNSLVEKKLSGPQGKWNCLLPPGKFRVEIKKGPAGHHPGFIDRFDLEVKGGGAPVLLGRKLV